MMAFLDSSILLRYLFQEHNFYSDFKKVTEPIASELLKAERFRCIDRLRLRNCLTDGEVAHKRHEFQMAFQTFTVIPVQTKILNRASDSFPTSLGTLDAIHLASALLYREQIGKHFLFLTHDKELATAALAMDFEVQGI